MTRQTLSSLPHQLAREPYIRDLIDILDQLSEHIEYQYSKKRQESTLSLSLPNNDPHVLFTRLKSLHRKTTLAEKSIKQVTADARSQVDSMHLSLQNLWYKRAHLEKEITRCQAYESIYQDIDMPNEQDILRNEQDILRNEQDILRNGEDILKNEKDGIIPMVIEKENQKGENTENTESRINRVEKDDIRLYKNLDSHARMLYRLNKELTEREALDKEKKDFQAQKLVLTKENKLLGDELEKLDLQLEAFVASAKPIQAVFDRH